MSLARRGESYASVIATVVWQWTPFEMLILLAGLQSQDRGVLEAARVDGASAWASFREITLPHLRSYLELGVLLGAIYVVNTFDAFYMITQGGPGTATLVPGLDMYQSAFSNDQYGYGMAIGTLLFAVMLVFTLAAMRLLRSRTA